MNQQPIGGTPPYTVKASFPNGVAVVHQSATGATPFHARLIRRNLEGRLEMSGMEVIGDFATLQEATHALQLHSTEPLRWKPDTGFDLHSRPRDSQPTGTE